MSTVSLTLRTTLIVICFLLSSRLGAATIDFEGLPDSTILTNQYAALTFSNAIILTAGISLNEFEFPPHSGQNVASDNTGPMTISFGSPITGFSGFFNYSVALTLQAFDTGGTPVASAMSAFSNNEGLSGEQGSSPNELLKLSFANGISRVTITGDPAGGSFTLDDLTFTAGESVPEPASGILFLTAAGFLACRRKKRP